MLAESHLFLKGKMPQQQLVDNEKVQVQTALIGYCSNESNQQYIMHHGMQYKLNMILNSIASNGTLLVGLGRIEKYGKPSYKSIGKYEAKID